MTIGFIFYTCSISAEVSEGKSMGELYNFLSEDGFIIEKQIAELIERVLASKRKALLLRGPAGVGKTQLASLIAEYLKADLVFFQCSYGTSEDDLLYKYVPSESTKSGIKVTLGPIPLALKLSQNKKVVLLVDEFDKTRPSADALLLDVLQNFRVALYLDDKETVISGNPDNLVIFLTSNDMREFSEPLIRRVVTITLKALPVEKVFELLSKRVRRETALLLAQIYADTINANLRKPATIQELYQLGEIIETGVEMPLEGLLRIFIVKYDDDWKKYVDYVSSREPYKFIANNNSQSDNISNYYEPNGDNIIVFEDRDRIYKDEDSSIQLLLEKLGRFNVKRPPDEKVEPILLDGNQTIEVTLKIPDNDFDAYSKVIKLLRPEPTDDPRKFGKFEYVHDEINAIISNKPLTLEEVRSIINKTKDVEAYYETTFLTGSGVESLDHLFNSATKVKYYTKDKVFLEYEGTDVTEKIVLEKENNIIMKAKGYVKRINSGDTPLLKALKRHHDELNTANNLLKVLRFCKNINTGIDAAGLSDGGAGFDGISPVEVVTILQNAKNIKNANVYVTVDGFYTIRMEKREDTIKIEIGHPFKNRLREHGFTGKYTINSGEVEKIIQVLLEWQ